jgi:hypothetical protein
VAVLKHKWQELKTSCKAITQIVQYDGYKINKIVDGIDAVEGVILNSLNSYYHHLHMQISNTQRLHMQIRKDYICKYPINSHNQTNQ